MASGEAVKKAGRLVRLGAWAIRVGKATPPYLSRKGSVFWYYAKVELRPPSPREFPEIQESFNRALSTIRTGGWKNMSFRDGLLNAGVTLEIMFIFFFGECLGKHSFIGYDVPGTHGMAIEHEMHHLIEESKKIRSKRFSDELKEAGKEFRAKQAKEAGKEFSAKQA